MYSSKKIISNNTQEWIFQFLFLKESVDLKKKETKINYKNLKLVAANQWIPGILN